MAPVAVNYMGRAQTPQAVAQLGLLTGALVSLWRLLADSTEPDPSLTSTNRPVEPDLAQRPPTLGEQIDPLEYLAVLRAQCREVEQLHGALQTLGVAIPSEMPAQVSHLAGLAEAVLWSRRPASGRKRTDRVRPRRSESEHKTCCHATAAREDPPERGEQRPHCGSVSSDGSPP
jgi:hypothetical protein